MENVESRPTKDALNAKVFGTAQENAKYLIGQTTKQPAIKRLNK